MKHVLFLMLACCMATTSYGQNIIEWRKDKVTQIIFPAEIVKCRTGYIAGPSDNFDALTQSDGKVLYIQPVMPLDETNLNVVTSDGYYYAFNLVYNEAAKCVNYIIQPAMAFYHDVTVQTNVPEASDPYVSDADVAAADESVLPDSTSLFAKVSKQGAYIVTNNVAKLQKLIFVLKGVYVDRTHIFFKFSIQNSSNVPFDIDYIAFSITARKTKKTSSQERLQILPVGADVDIHTVGAKSICDVIYCFEKFTIGKDKVLLAEVLEQGGDRNIGLRISENFIIEARKL